MNARLEHANLKVHHFDEAIRFLRTAFPEFRIRHESGPGEDRRWAHVGTDENYIAISEATMERHSSDEPYSGYPGVQHLGWEVEDVEALRQRLTEAGFQDNTVPNNHPHRKRVYFLDADGNDWEFVQYLSDDPEERHDYALPG